MQMNVKLLIAAIATVFISVVAGAVISTVASTPAQTVVEESPTATAEATATIPPTETPSPEPTMRPVVDAEVVLQREATYQARLSEANKMIAEAATALIESRANERRLANQFNKVVSQPTATPAVVQVVAVAPEPPAPQPTDTQPERLAPEAALAIAVALDPGAQLLRTPELVMYEDAVAYEFVFEQGTIYINAQDGVVMYNGIAVMQEAQRQAAAAAAAAAPAPAPAAPAPTNAPRPTAAPTHHEDDHEEDDHKEDDHKEDEDSHDKDKENDD